MSTLTVNNPLPDVLVSADDLPSLPTVAMEVLRLARDEESSLEDFADVISMDPALAAKLLKLSNSSLFSLGNEVTNIKQATMVLGIKTVQLMALSFSLVSSVAPTGYCDSFDLREYWRRSLIRSVAGRMLCNLMNNQMGDEAFVCGLLGNIGQLVLAKSLPDTYQEVYSLTEDKNPFPEDEQNAMGFHRGDVAMALMNDWGLPPVMGQSIGYMHRPELLPEETEEDLRTLCWVLKMACMTENLLCDEDKGAAMSQLHNLASSHGLSSEAIDTFLIELEVSLAETAELLELDVGEKMDHQSILEAARLQMVNVSLGTAADLQTVERRANHLENENAKLVTEATTDRLTSIGNRSYFDDTLAAEIDIRSRTKVPNSLGLLLMDIDHFKKFNDTHGHQAGDKVLRTVGMLLKKALRKTDYPARYGGEEFAVIVPQTTPSALRNLAERVRSCIESVNVPYEGKILKVTASLGGVCLTTPFEGFETKQMIEIADQLLYQSKEAGRNRATIADEPMDS